jgi:hypothetical protein
LRKPTVILACALSAGALALPACGGGDEPAAQNPASEQAPPERVGQLERRVKELEQENQSLRRQLEERESGSVGEGDDASRGADSGSGADGGSASGAGAGAGAGSGGGSGSAGGSGGSGGRADAGAGPDPGTPEDDRSVYDICGPNPAPNC